MPYGLVRIATSLLLSGARRETLYCCSSELVSNTNIVSTILHKACADFFNPSSRNGKRVSRNARTIAIATVVVFLACVEASGLAVCS